MLPLLAYGVVSILLLRTGGQQAIIQGNLNVARPVLQSRSSSTSPAASRSSRPSPPTFSKRASQQWQQDRILKNFVLEVSYNPRELTLLDESGRPIVSSSLGKPTV